jgi:cobalt/nickel transport system permease protein
MLPSDGNAPGCVQLRHPMSTRCSGGVRGPRLCGGEPDVHLIDRYAYSNRLRSIEPAHKVALAASVLVLCLLLSEPAVGATAVIWMVVLAVIVAGVPARVFGRVLLAEATFLVLTTVGVMVSIGASPVSGAGGWVVSLGPLWVSSSPQALERGIELVARALGCAAAMNFLALTTPLVDILELLRRWHVPSIVIDIMTITYRSVFLLLESADAMHVAQDSRLGYQGPFRRRIESAALLASQLFIDAYRRSTRLQTALEARGFDGQLRVLPATYRTDRRLLAATAVASLSLVAVGVAL